jgi:hypothetical protein
MSVVVVIVVAQYLVHVDSANEAVISVGTLVAARQPLESRVLGHSVHA